MIDFKKEIKLSDLVRQDGGGERSRPKGEPAGRPRRSARGRRELVGLKIGATQLAAARVVEQRLGAPAPAGPAAAPAGHRRPRRGPRRPRARGGARTSSSRSTRCRAAASGSGSRRTTSASAASRSPASTTSASSRTRCSSAPTTPSPSPSTRRSSTTASSARRSTRAAPSTGRSCSSPPTASRSSATSRRSAQAGIELVGIDLEALRAASRRRAHPRATAPRRTPRSSSSTPGTSGRRSRSRTAACASSRACSSGAARSSPRPSPASSASPRPRPSSCSRASRSSRPDRPSVEADRRSEQAREAVRGELQALARELVASLEYYQAQPGSLPISEILLAGGTSRIPGLAAELERLTRVRVRLADPLVRVQADDSLERARRPGFAGRRDRTGGGGLMRAVNLLPEQNRRRRRPDAPDHEVGARRRRDTRHRSRPRLRRLVRAEPRQGVGPARHAGRAAAAGRRARGRQATGRRPPGAATSARVAAFTTAASARMRWDNLLDDVSRVLPAGSWLSSLNMQSGTAAPATASPTPATPTADRPDRVHRLGLRVHARTSSPA